MTSQEFPVRRRSLLAGSAALASGTALIGSGTAAPASLARSPEGTVDPLEFFSSVSLLNANEEPLTDDELIAVWAEPTARNEQPVVERRSRSSSERTTRQPGVSYADGASIPLVAIDDRNDGTVAGAGALLGVDGTSWAQGNEEFLLNLLDRLTGRAGGTEHTVLFHEYTTRENTDSAGAAGPGYRQPWRLEDYGTFVDYAGDHGYTFVSDQDDRFRTPGTPRFVTALQRTDPDVVMLVTPERFNDAELRVLERYVQNGGNVLLVNSGDLATMPAKEFPGVVDEEFEYGFDRVGVGIGADDLPDEAQSALAEANPDERNTSKHLNEIAERLGVGFRFNADRVLDGVSKQGEADNIPLTANFNDDRFPELFADRDGLDPDGVQYGYRGVVDYVADGDTFRVLLQNGVEVETRLLGYDTTESADNGCFERPAEWEGLSYDKRFEIADLRFDAARSLVAAGGDRLTAADDPVAVQAEETATSEGAGGGYTDYAGTPPALVTATDGVVAAGSLLVRDGDGSLTGDDGVPVGNYDFLQNVWDDHLAGAGTVLFDESHGQPHTLEDDFAGFLEEVSATYTVEATGDLLADLEGADAVWLTPATEPFSGRELARLQRFVREGGAVFVHASAGDPVTHLNDVLDRLRTGVRVNDDRVTDPENNAGAATSPTTSSFTTYADGDSYRYPYFVRRLSEDGVYQNECNKPNYDYLESWASKAGDFLRDKVESKKVKLRLDPNASAYDGLGRLLAYCYYDAGGDDSYDTLVNRELVANGYARVYDSGHSLHPSFLAAELDAQRNGRGMWLQMDAENAPEVRNRPVEEVVVPQAASVRTADGPLPGGRAPLFAERTASQQGDPGVAYERVPLVGVDEDARVAMVGGPICEEAYEMPEDHFRSLSFVTDADPIRVNSMAFDNYAFLLNLIDALAAEDNDGRDVLVDGGHFQFGSPSDRFGGGVAQSADDMAYFQRFLEGLGLRMRGVNDLIRWLDDDALDPRALIVTTPMAAFTDEEVAAVRSFAADGGAVVLMGSSRARTETRGHLNDLATGLGTDLRLSTDRIADETNNVRGVANVLRTRNRNPAFDLFDRVAPEGGDDAPTAGPDGDILVEGSRSDRGTEPPESSRVYTAGEDVVVEITVEDVDRPVTIRDDVRDSVTKSWTVYEDRGDVTGVDEVRGLIELGRVTPPEVAGEKTVTKRYVVEAPRADQLPDDPIVASPAPVGDDSYSAGVTTSGVSDDDRAFISAFYTRARFGPAEAVDARSGRTAEFTEEEYNYVTGGVDRNERETPGAPNGSDGEPPSPDG